MKCTNKCLALLTALAVCFGATGCSDEAIAFSYNPDYKVSAFRISGDTGFETADAFASGLCVVNGDINTDNSAVDMTDATSAGLFDLNSRTVLYAKNIHERLAPASLTKLMTAVVALKYGNPNDVITVSSNMGNLESGAVVCGLAEGDQLTLNQALHALLIKSANDAAVAIAEHIGGSVEGFADMMNEEAQAIGATNSHFVNPHGLNAENHYVTAYDMYLIFNEALKYDTVNEIISMTSYDTVYTDKNGNEKTLSVKNTNQYLAGNVAAPDRVTVIGGKTGTADKTGTKDVVVSFMCFAPADDPQIIMLLTMDTPSRTTGTAVFGGTMVAPVASQIMGEILPMLGIEPDYTAEELVGADTTVPNVVGQTREAAEDRLQSLGFTYRTVGNGDTVTDQPPAGGAIVPGNATIILYLGQEKPDDPCTVPNVVGMTASAANKALTNAGLIMKVTGTTSASSGNVYAITQSLPGGTEAAAGTVVTVQFGDNSVLD